MGRRVTAVAGSNADGAERVALFVADLTRALDATRVAASDCSMDNMTTCAKQRALLARHIDEHEFCDRLQLNAELQSLLRQYQGATSDLLEALVRRYGQRFDWLADRSEKTASAMPMLSQLMRA